MTAISSVALVSYNIGVPSAFISSRFGHRWSQGLGTILTTVSYLLLWSTKFNQQVYEDNIWLLFIYFILIGETINQYFT